MNKYTSCGIKYIIFISLIISNRLCAQNSWNTNGNTGSFSSFIGTTNNFPFLFRTNNIERIRIQPNGFVGIGVSNPLQRLDVFGNVRIRGNVYVDQNVFQQGEFESDSIDAGLIQASNMVAQKLNVDSLKAYIYVMNELSRIVGTAKFEETANFQKYLKAKLGVVIGNETTSTYNVEPMDTTLRLEVKEGNARFRGNVLIDGISNFTGNAKFNNGKILLGESQNAGIEVIGNNFYPVNDSYNNVMNFGLVNHSFINTACNSNNNPDAWNYNFNGSISIYNWNDSNAISNITPTALNIGHNGQNAYIDLSQNDASGQNEKLLINTLCGHDVIFGNIGNRRGNVYINNKLGIGTEGLNSNSLLEIGSNTFAGVEYLFKVRNTDNINAFAIKPSGRVEINCNGITNLDECLWVNGKIKSREVIVTQENWPDYVFDEGYMLQNLEVTEKYIKENKHLPNVPDAKTIEEKGTGVAEMQKIMMEKIEELTLHIIQLNKRIKELELK